MSILSSVKLDDIVSCGRVMRRVMSHPQRRPSPASLTRLCLLLFSRTENRRICHQASPNFQAIISVVTECCVIYMWLDFMLCTEDFYFNGTAIDLLSCIPIPVSRNNLRSLRTRIRRQRDGGGKARPRLPGPFLSPAHTEPGIPGSLHASQVKSDGGAQ